VGGVPGPRAVPVPLADTRPLRRAVLRPTSTVDELAAHEPLGAVAFGVLAADGTLRATGLVGPDGEDDGRGGWRIRGMATAPEARGQGLGGAVLAAVVAHAEGHGARRIWCNARTPALGLYERAGFRVVSGEFELPEIGPHRVMER
jgi:ribosomal protein S18 acetylase RimI-like enzyme